jgi:hypothetical protein
MPKYNDKFAVISGTLNADVANNGTFTVAYPTGLASQQYFDTGLAVPGAGTILLNDSDRYTIAGGGFTLAFGASNITVTNTSGVTWLAGSKFGITVDKQDGNNVLILPITYNLASLANGALLNPGLRPGFKGSIEYCEAYVQTAGNHRGQAVERQSDDQRRGRYRRCDGADVGQHDARGRHCRRLADHRGEHVRRERQDRPEGGSHHGVHRRRRGLHAPDAQDVVRLLLRPSGGASAPPTTAKSN